MPNEKVREFLEDARKALIHADLDSMRVPRSVVNALRSLHYAVLALVESGERIEVQVDGEAIVRASPSARAGASTRVDCDASEHAQTIYQLKEEVEDWRGAGRALGFETANPRASLLAYKAGWESRRMEAATATVRFARAKLMERFNQQADVADALRELGAKLPPTKRGVLPELIEKALLDVMDALKDDPEKVFDFDPDEEG